MNQLSGNTCKCYEFIYQESKLPRELLQSFNVFREEDTLTDVEVEVENESFRCHKVILAAASPYYKALFKHDPQANQSSKLSFPNTRPAVFREILDFMYTSKLTITAENVMEVLELADFLQFRDVVHCCCNILQQHINVNNAISILQCAEAHLCQSLAHAANTFIRSHFQHVQQTHDFVKLSFESLVGFLSDRTTVVSSEEKLLYALCLWINTDEEERRCCIETLFEFVHFAALTGEQKTELQRLFPFVQAFLKELEVVESIDQIIADNDNGGSAQNVKTNRPAKSIVLVPENINQHGGTEKVMLLYQPQEGKWSHLSQIPQEGTVSLQRVASLDNCIYITGGEVNGIPTNRVLKYDVATNTWTKCAPMNRARFNHGLTQAMGYLYAFGGDSGSVRMDDEFGSINTLERYNPQTDQWDMLEALDSVSPDSRAAFHSRFTLSNFDLVHVGDYLYVIGGTVTTRSWTRRRGAAQRTPTEPTMSRHTNVETYHLETNSWNSDSWLLTEFLKNDMKLHSGTCYPYSGLLLLIDEDMRGKKMKLYNPVTHRLWDFLPTHGQHRFGGYLLQDDCLYAIGGMCMIRGVLQGHDLMHRMTLTDGADPHWEMLDPLPFPLSHYKAVGVLK